MYPHTPPSTADLDALRVRLYRPEPPEGAVEAYLDALHARDPIAALEAPPTATRTRGLARGLGALASMVVVAVALGAVMSLSHQASATGAASVSGGSGIEPPPVPGAPIGTLAGPDGTTGLFDGGGSHVVVGVSCSGTGTLDLVIDDAPPTILTCEPGGPALALLPSSGALDRFTVAVARHGAVRWSLSVGAVDLADA